MLLNEDTREDLRVRRTRSLIENAFMELIEEKGFQQLTIQELADRAMINRATFYRHFEDKYALFEYVMHRLFEDTLARKLPPEFNYCAGNLQVLISTVCDFLAQVEGHCGPLEQQSLPAYNEKIVELIRGILMRWFEEGELAGPEDPDLSAYMVSWAIYGAASHWRKTQSGTETSEAFAKRATALIAQTFAAGEHSAR